MGVAGFLLFKAFVPVQYEAPVITPRPGIKRWKLTTGSDIAYLAVPGKGHPQPHPVIFLHDGPGGYFQAKAVEMLGKLAEDGYDVYFYDQAGSGESGKLAGVQQYTVERHKKDLEAVIHSIGPGKAILVGEGWGAVLGTLFLADHRDKVEKLILLNPTPLLPVLPELKNAPPPDSLHLKPALLATEDVPFSIRAWTVKTAAALGVKLANDKEADSYQTWLHIRKATSLVCEDGKPLPEEGRNGGYAAFLTEKSGNATTDLRPALKEIKVPVLVIKGTCDDTAWGFTREYLSLFSNAKLLTMLGSGHQLFASQSEICFNAIRYFIIQN